MYSVRYEGYGPGDCAVMVDCLTDDSARAAKAVRMAFLNHGGRLGAAGAIAYLFKEVGRLHYPASVGLASRSDSIWESGAEEMVVAGDGSVEILTDPIELDTVRSRLEPLAGEPDAAGITMRSAVRVELSAAQATRLAQLLRALESLDDVRSIYTNAENAGELLESV